MKFLTLFSSLLLLTFQLWSQSILLNWNSDPASCVPGGDGSIRMMPAGGQPPYTYYWLPGSFTTANLYNLAAGSYSVTVTDANGRSNTTIASVLTSPSPTLVMQHSNPSCARSNDGNATVTAYGFGGYTYSWSHNTSINNHTASGLNAGSYFLTVTDWKGCNSFDTVNLVDPPAIDTTVSQNGLSLTSNQNGASYQWLDYTNTGMINPINGANAQAFVAPINGLWAVKINYNGCVDTSTVMSTFTIGLEDNDPIINGLSIFPNPSKGMISIHGQSINGESLQLYSISGKLVIEEISPSSSFQMNLEHLKEGIYFLKVGNKRSKIILTN